VVEPYAPRAKGRRRRSGRDLALLNYPLVEKTVLIGLVTTVFWQPLPDTDHRLFHITLGIGIIVIANAWIGSWLASRGTSWASTGASFVGTGAINLSIVFSLQLLTGGENG